MALTLGAVGADPAREALAGAVDGVAGPVLGALAQLSTVLPKPPAGTHCKHEALTAALQREWQQITALNIQQLDRKFITIGFL